MDSALMERHDEVFEAALEERGARDPREFYRERLRELKQENREACEKAIAHYRDTLVPGIAGGEIEPLSGWLEYGRRLAEWTAPGRTVEIDASGRAHPWSPPVPEGRLVLHLPEGRTRAILVGLPTELTEAQQATYDLLVAGRQKLRSEYAE